MKFFIDNRWEGAHGIARYSSEVMRSLTVSHQVAPLKSRPGSARDLLTPRIFLESDQWLYSPGYNAGIARGKQIVTVHDLIHLHSGSLKHRFYYEQVLKPAIRKAGVTLTVSEFSRIQIQDWLNDDSVKVVNCGNGISEDFVPEGPPSFRERPYLLFVGNLKSHKRPEIAFEVASRLPEIDLVIVGPTRPAVESYAKDYGLGKRLISMSQLSDLKLAALYRDAVATIVPSKIEGFGLPAAESIACGTPVIYSADCESLVEIVQDNGVAIDSGGSIDLWIGAFLHLRQQRPYVHSQKVSETYRWETVSGRVDGVLREIID